MLDDLKAGLVEQQRTLLELEEELEMEISRVIGLKNKIEPNLIEDLEKVEEGLYVEVKMIHETKKNVDNILKVLISEDDKGDEVTIVQKSEFEKHIADVEKFKKRSEKLAKQLIEANEEIEGLTGQMESTIKNRENEIKNDMINKLKEKDRIINDKLLEAKKREEELINELEKIKQDETRDSANGKRMKEFFDKKIINLKNTMAMEFKEREKEIAKKAITVYNMKKEKTYYAAVYRALQMNARTPEVELILETLRDVLELSDDVYLIDNFSLCKACNNLVHISQDKCPTCKIKVKF